jgi:hypothetical protein
MYFVYLTNNRHSNIIKQLCPDLNQEKKKRSNGILIKFKFFLKYLFFIIEKERERE